MQQWQSKEFIYYHLLTKGLVIGYSFYPSLVKPNKKLKPITIGILVIAFSIGAYAITKKHKKRLKQMLMELKNNGIYNWGKSLKLLYKVNTYNLPETLLLKNKKLIVYGQLRVKIYTTILKAILE